MKRKRKLNQSIDSQSQSTRETHNNFCIVCSINYTTNSNCCDTLTQDVDLAQLFSIFCKYFKIKSSQLDSLNYGNHGDDNISQNSGVLSLFCLKCMELLEKLWDQDVQLNILQNHISHTVALLASNILQQQSGEEITGVTSKSRNNQAEKPTIKQLIRQQFSPRVILQDLYKDKNCPSQNQNQNQSEINCNVEVEEEPIENDNISIKDEQFDDDYAEDLHLDNIESEIVTREEQEEKEEKEQEREKEKEQEEIPKRIQKRGRLKVWTKIEDSSSSSQVYKKYKCINCNETFASAKLVILHYKSNHVRAVIPNRNLKNKRPRRQLTKGPTPGTFLYHKKWLIETISPEENNSNAFRCGTCQYDAKSQAIMLGHILDVHLHSIGNQSKLVCPVCGHTSLKVKGPQHFLAHMSRHWTENERPEVISVGYSRFLYKGIWFFGQSSDNQYRCFKCQAVTSSQEEMLEHIESQHKDFVICEFCGEKFRGAPGLQSHMSSFGDHSNLGSLGDGKFTYRIGQKQWPFEKIEENSAGLQDRIRFKCGSCPSKIWTLVLMKRHIKDLHSDQKKIHVCPTCGRTFSSLPAFVDHTKVMHSDPEHFSFTCPTCGFGAKTRKRLSAHEEKHKEWKCRNCQKIFQYIKGLQNHQKKHCSGIHGNNCPKCLVYFKRKDSLQSHIDSGECTGNSSNASRNRLKRVGSKLPRQREEPNEQHSSESIEIGNPKKRIKTEINSSSNNKEKTTSTSQNEEEATELWTFGMGQNQMELS